MRDFSSRDWANHGCLYGRLPVERHELDLESFAVGVDMNHCSDVAAFQGFGRHRAVGTTRSELVIILRYAGISM